MAGKASSENHNLHKSSSILELATVVQNMKIGDMYVKKGKWLQYIGIAFVSIWVLRFPATRAVIVWLLPLGSGWDDLVQMILLAVIVFLFVTKNVFFGKKIKDRFSWFKNIFKDEE